LAQKIPIHALRWYTIPQLEILGWYVISQLGIWNGTMIYQIFARLGAVDVPIP